MLHCNTAFPLHWIYRKVRRTYSHFRPFFIFAKLESFMVGENVGLILLSTASLPLRASTNVHTVTRLQGVRFKLSNWKHPKILYQFILFILSNGFPVALTLYESKSAKIQQSKFLGDLSRGLIDILLGSLDWIHVFYPVHQQVSQQGSQWNKNVFQQIKKTITKLRNLFANRIKRFYSVEILVQKPVGEQDKTHEFSL